MIVVLLYHRIADDGWRYSVSRDHFAQQLDVLCHETDIVPLADITRLHTTSPRPRVAITFDDGYGDNVTSGWPELQARALPATFFVVSGGIGAMREFWWDELDWILSHAVPTPPAASYWEAHERLRRCDADQQRQLLDGLAAACEVHPVARPDKLPMTHAQLACLASEPRAEIAAHTVAHPLLPLLSSDAQALEIDRSKRDLEAMTGRPVTTFSYPYGGHSPETCRLVERAGFHSAYKVGNVPIGEAPRFALPRMVPKDWDGEQLAKQLHDYRA
jgi:peptidoglycan/xylan/chitin deacetylase (PgdA/CDA1 family)